MKTIYDEYKKKRAWQILSPKAIITQDEIVTISRLEITKAFDKWKSTYSR